MNVIKISISAIYTPGSNDASGTLSGSILRFSLPEITMFKTSQISQNNSAKKLKSKTKKNRLNFILKSNGRNMSVFRFEG